jgi:hypothetical protein
MPLISNFKSTTVWKAFCLNSIIAAMSVTVALVAKDQFDKIFKPNSGWTILSTFVITLAVTFGIYVAMHFAVGFGGGMITS